jgi:hypothetical protein
MFRRIAPALLAILVLGCAGPSKLAERSEHKLATGDHWHAWELATRALDKAPANTRARAAALAAASSISDDWQRRIHALAEVDSIGAAEQALEFAEFRAKAIRYVTVPVASDWSKHEMALRRNAAHQHYEKGVEAMASRRPKQASLHFAEAEHYVSGYRDAAALAERAYQDGLSRVAFVPFRSGGGDGFGREIAADWSNELAQHMEPPAFRFTRVLTGDAIERQMTVSQLGGLSREGAARLGRKAGADRVVWGAIGPVKCDTRLRLFTDVIARRIHVQDAEGHEETRWVEVPIEVVARIRTATVPVEYELITTRGAATLARNHVERTAEARVVWTLFSPEGDLGDYALVSDVLRAADPNRAKQIESRWKDACGDKTTLGDVLAARRSTRGSQHYSRDVLPRFIAGAAFLFMEDLPPQEDMAYAALAGGWQSVASDLARIDPIDDVDLNVEVAGDDVRH